MSKYTPILKEFLAWKGWKEDAIGDGSEPTACYRCKLMLCDQLCPVFFDLDDARDRIAVTIYLPFRVPAQRREQACVLLNLINRRTTLGRMDMDPEDGELRFQTGVNVESIEPSLVFIDNLVGMGSSMITRRMNCLAQVAFTECSPMEIDASYRQLAATEQMPLIGVTQAGPVSVH